MEQRDLELLEQYRAKDPELSTLWENHLLYKQQLSKLESKVGLTPQEDMVIKEIKKKKLAGKTKIQSILDRYRG